MSVCLCVCVRELCRFYITTPRQGDLIVIYSRGNKQLTPKPQKNEKATKQIITTKYSPSHPWLDFHNNYSNLISQNVQVLKQWLVANNETFKWFVWSKVWIIIRWERQLVMTFCKIYLKLNLLILRFYRKSMKNTIKKQLGSLTVLWPPEPRVKVSPHNSVFVSLKIYYFVQQAIQSLFHGF